MSGQLVLVATPIGNLGDLAPRAAEALRGADLILCEDTRRTRHLLSAIDVPGAGRLMAFHEHNEYDKTPGVLERLARGDRVVLVCDAGTPGISDPGGRLVAEAVAVGIEVTTVPGPSALLAALVISGLATDRFVMEGFLPRKGADRRARVGALVDELRTVVLFESPRRVGATVAELAEHLGGTRRVVVARELTKLHEEVWRGSLAEAVERYEGAEVRGEVVIVLEGAAEVEAIPPSDTEVLAALADARRAGLSTRDAASTVAASLGISRRGVYDLAIGSGTSKG